MKISTKSQYGLRALIFIALNSTNKPVAIKEISDAEKISVRYLANILTKLRAYGILKSKKGKNGGFILAQKASQITLFDIIKILEEKLSLTNCLKFERCKMIKTCLAKKAWHLLNQNIINTLKNITLSDIINEGSLNL